MKAYALLEDSKGNRASENIEYLDVRLESLTHRTDNLVLHLSRQVHLRPEKSGTVFCVLKLESDDSIICTWPNVHMTAMGDSFVVTPNFSVKGERS